MTPRPTIRIGYFANKEITLRKKQEPEKPQEASSVPRKVATRGLRILKWST